MAISIEVIGAKYLSGQLKKAAKDMPDAIDRGVVSWGQDTRRFFKAHGYPGQRHLPNPPRTEKQRRFIHWAVKNGAIGIPYRRKGTLANSFYSRKIGQAEVEVGNTAAHAELTIGENQAFAHKGWWWRFKNEIKSRYSLLEASVEEEISKILPR